MGTYKSQSDGIQGMLDTMKDSFESDLAEAIKDEAAALSHYNDLMTTKAADKAMLIKTQAKKSLENGNDAQQLADDNVERQETQATLKDDQAFLETTTNSCEKRAGEWAMRTQLRTQELQGIHEAVTILSEGAGTFENSTAFVQTSVEHVHHPDPKKDAAYKALSHISDRGGSLRLTSFASRIATRIAATTGGHFDAVMADIDGMVADLNAEAADDESHKVWCNKERFNANEKDDALQYDLTELEGKNERSETKKGEVEAEITRVSDEIVAMETSLKNSLDARSADQQAFNQALKDDTEAIRLITEAMGALGKAGYGFIQKPHSLAHSLGRHSRADQDPEGAPTPFSGSSGVRTSEGGGLLAILDMIKNDVKQEVSDSRAAEKFGEENYFKLRKESEGLLDDLENEKITLEHQLAVTRKTITDTTKVHTDNDASKNATLAYLESLKPNCDWVEQTYETRKTNRQAETDGLKNARIILSGAAGDIDAGLVATQAVVKKSEKIITVAQELNNLNKAPRDYMPPTFLQRK